MVQYRIKKPRGRVAREAKAAYKEVLPPYEPIPETPVFHVNVTDRGRIVLPAEIREKLKIKDGDRVALILEDDGAVSLLTQDVALDKLQGMFKHLARPGRLESDELIKERRREAKKEERKFREWDARLRKAGK